jgi:hypothetical protein
MNGIIGGQTKTDGGKNLTIGIRITANKKREINQQTGFSHLYTLPPD